MLFFFLRFFSISSVIPTCFKHVRNVFRIVSDRFDGFRRISTDFDGSMSDVFGSRSDVFGSRSDVFGSRSDVFGSRLDVVGSRPDVFGSRSGVFGSRSDKYCSENKVRSSVCNVLDGFLIHFFVRQSHMQTLQTCWHTTSHKTEHSSEGIKSRLPGTLRSTHV